MRRMLSALVAGLAVAGGAAAFTGGAQAQPYGYYGAPGYYGYRYDPPRTYGPTGAYTPYNYYNGYDGYNGYGGYSGYDGYGGYGAAGSVLGAALAPEILGHAPYDEYGPDPNGLVAPDGHQIKCKLIDNWDSYRNAYVKRRQCW